MKASRLSSWGLTAVLLSSIACGSSGGTGTGGHAGSSATGGHAGASATGGHGGLGGSGTGGAGGALGGAGGTSNGGGGGTSNGGAGGALGGHAGGGAGGSANGGAGGTANGGAGGSANGGAGGAPQSTNFHMSLTPSGAMVAQGASQMVTVTIDRNAGSTAFTGAIALALQGAPTGVTGAFTPASVPSGSASSMLTLTVASTVATGAYNISVVGTSGADTYSTPFVLTVTAPATLALVDDDNSDNNDPANSSPTPSASDSAFNNWLQGESITNYVTKVSQSDTSPTYTELQNYSTIIWYAGDSANTPTTAKTQTIQDLIDAGGKTIIIFDEKLYYVLSLSDWTTVSNTFVKNYIGAQGAVYSVQNAALGDALETMNFVASGVTGTAFANLMFQIDVGSGGAIGTQVDVTNPGTGVDQLVTVPADPTGGGTDMATPVVVGHKHAGTAGTSTVIYVGLPVENIHGAPKSTAQQFFHAILVYAGLKAS